MIEFKKYLGEHFLGKTLHFTCDCIIQLDITGICVDYTIQSNELILTIDVDGKYVKIGENHPNLFIEEK